MEFSTCMQTRRSVRRFTGEPVSRELLSQAAAMAQHAPSWKNSQTVRYFFVDAPEKKANIAQTAVLGFGKNAEIIRNAAALLVLTTLHGVSGYDADGTPTTAKGSHWESFDAGIAAQSFCLAAHDLGLGTVIMGIFDPDQVASLLNLPEDQMVSCLIAVGIPAEGPHGKPIRKPFSEIVTFV